jgi:hypothetical protein
MAQVDRRVLLATSAIGYLGGAVWNGGLIYDGWLSYIVTTDWLFLVALIVFSDPDEPWPAPFWPE